MNGRQILPLLSILLVCACGGGLDTHEGVADAMAASMEDIATILEGIDSKEAADAAAGDLEKTAERMAEISEAYKKLGDPDKETEAELEKQYKGRMMESVQRIGKAAQTAGPFLAESPKCQEAFQRVGEKMQSMN